MEEYKSPQPQEISLKSVIRKNVFNLKKEIIRSFNNQTTGSWIRIRIFFLILIPSIMILILHSQNETWLFYKVLRWFFGSILSLELLKPFISVFFMGIQK